MVAAYNRYVGINITLHILTMIVIDYIISF